MDQIYQLHKSSLDKMYVLCVVFGEFHRQMDGHNNDIYKVYRYI